MLSRARRLAEVPVRECRSCGARIFWARTVNGNKIPIDAEPAKRVVLTTDHGADIVGAEVVDTFTPHHATCPNAAEHRKARG